MLARPNVAERKDIPARREALSGRGQPQSYQQRRITFDASRICSYNVCVGWDRFIHWLAVWHCGSDFSGQQLWPPFRVQVFVRKIQ